MWILLRLYVSLFMIGRIRPRRVPRKLRPLLFISDPPPPPTSSSSEMIPFEINELNSKYDVFISFRGGDVRETFLSVLYFHLNDYRKMRVYKDDVDLERGRQISPSILEAVERSESYIVIFSPNFASSEWCLDELVKILECGERYGRKVIPVFYGGVDPSHVENLTGSYRKVPSETIGKVRSWRAALTTAASFSGFDSRVIRPEMKLIEEISKAVLQVGSNEIMPVSYWNDGLVGIERRMNEIEIGEDNPTIGLWGMGGIGKTTLAKAIFDRFSGQFEASYFFSNFSDQLYDTNLQNDLFSKLLGLGGDQNAGRIPLDLKLRRIARTKCLIIIDDVGNDVGNIRQLNNLFNGRYCNLFAPGSVIVMTSRNQQLLKNVCHRVYEVKALDETEALRLFCLHAFKEPNPPIEYEKTSRRATASAGGSPLALTVLGSHLYGRDIEFWNVELNALQHDQNQTVKSVLKRSYDGLGRVERSVFLDIACFYRKEISLKQIERLSDGYYVEHGGSKNLITNLVDKSILRVNVLNNGSAVEMHGLLQDLGQSMVDEEFRVENRSRLWKAEDIYHLFKQNKGTGSTEGILWNLSTGELEVEEIHMQSDTFAKLENLRFLEIRYGSGEEKRLPKLILPRDGLSCLPDALRILRWDSFPARCLSSEFRSEKLASIVLQDSNIEQLWEGKHNMGNLKLLDLKQSKRLKKLPDLSTFTRLEEIDLSGCEGLVELPLSILHLPKLEVLNLRNCASLELNGLGCYQESDPTAILPSLKTLNLSGTPIQNQKASRGFESSDNIQEEFDHFSNRIFQMKCLQEIRLSNCTKLKELPEVLEPMSALVRFDLEWCSNLSRLPDTIYNLVSLKYLYISHTPITELPSSIGNLACLSNMQLNCCTRLRSLPDTIHKLANLQIMDIFGCCQLTHLPQLPSSLKELNAYGCKSLRALSSSIQNHNLSHIKWNFGECGKLDRDICSLLFNKFTNDAMESAENHSPWLLLPTKGSSELGKKGSSDGNSLVTATFSHPRNLKGLIYYTFIHDDCFTDGVSCLPRASLSVKCRSPNADGFGEGTSLSYCYCLSSYDNKEDPTIPRSYLLVWYDWDVMRKEIMNVATAKFEFQVTYEGYSKWGGKVQVPILITSCGVVPVYHGAIDGDDNEIKLQALKKFHDCYTSSSQG